MALYVYVCVHVSVVFVKNKHGTSLVAQWLRICLPMQGTPVRAWSGKIPHAEE